MPHPEIGKPMLRVPPNLVSYNESRATFRWAAARAELSGLPGGALNIAHECVDRHVLDGRGDRVAIRWLGVDGTVLPLTYADLADRTARFAHTLHTLGLERGERVFVLSGRIPALYVAMLGTLKAGAVFCPLFSAFGPEPIRQRLVGGDGAVLVTTAALYLTKIAPMRDQLPALRHVLIVREGDEPLPSGTLDLDALLREADPQWPCVHTRPEEMALLHFTSGTTGAPKGAIHVHEAVVAHHITGRYALDLQADDVYWCTADPGWVTGTSYGIIAPLTNGVTMLVDAGEFSADRWYATLQAERVTNWYTAPTAIRMLMKAGSALPSEYDLRALRFVASVGEPLNPEAVVWGRDVLGVPIHDNWWQTETGGIMIANFAVMPIRPGSMGKPMPGVEAAIAVQRDAHTVTLSTTPDTDGELVLRAGWPSMFRGYLHMEERYARCFVDGWYCTGDIVRRDADGYYWFVGRADDLIKSSGHLVGPFEVESALLEHPAVAEAGVIGVPHPVAGELIRAYVSLRPGFTPGVPLRRELLAHARTRLGPAVAPRELEFLDTLPRTRSGKIMRRLLKARALGLPEGDTSTLER